MSDPAMKILICNDGSPQAENAVRLGASVAAGCGASVTLLGIVESAGGSKTMLEALARSQTILSDRKVPVELITKTGEPIAEIIRRTEEANYDLVVIGAVRKGVIGHFWMSTKSYKIIKEIKPPVLTVSGKKPDIKKILMCSGGKTYINNAVQLAGTIAKGLGAEITLLHVMPEPPGMYATLSRVEETEMQLLNSRSELGINLRQGKEALEAMGVKAGVHLRRGSVLEEILREIHDGPYELVVTGSALSRSLRTYMLGDISREIVNRLQCAVLVVRSQMVPRHPRLSIKGLIERLTR